MKKIFALHLLFTALLAACTMNGVSPISEVPVVVPTETLTPEPVEPWEVVLELDRVEQNVRIAAFYDDELGFTGGADAAGVFHSTHDGGQTWVASDTSSG